MIRFSTLKGIFVDKFILLKYDHLQIIVNFAVKTIKY